MDDLNEQILEGLAVTIALCGTAWSQQATQAACLKLQRKYPVRSVLAALDRCQDECKGRLALGDIVERIEEANAGGWPGPNEAWAAVGTMDEYSTLVCVAEAFAARATVATRGEDGKPSLLERDEVAARMAFLEAYKRMVSAAKAEQRRPCWQVSLGSDRAGRQRALLQAVERGWLPRAEAERQLGEPLGPKALPSAGLKLLAGEAQEPPKPQEVAAKLSELLGTFINPELARQAIEERRREWGAKPIVQAPDAGYRPPNREEVAELRRRQGQGS